ncbi:MAG: hypothetical protein OXL35_09735 [Chloroflexota bacterium]|nr:hypothetical protein [Chloroflexota bacterium]
MITSMTMWLAVGERGISSNAIALTTLGLHPTGRDARWPLDPADLRRCLLLLEAVPETCEDGLLVLAKRCPRWAALVRVWDRLAETLRSEIGETLPQKGSAPKTYALMQEVLDSAGRG